MEQKREERGSNPTPVQERYKAQEEAPLLDLIMLKSSRNRTAAKQVISSGRVSVEGVPTTRATDTVRIGQVVTVHKGAPPAPFSHDKIEIVWENEAYVVVYKKNGIPTVNTSHQNRQATVIYLLSQHYKKGEEGAKLFMVNRLDRNTAGFVIFAKTVEAKETLVKEFSRRVKHQTFIACVEGEITEKQQVLSATSSDEDSKKSRIISADVKVDKSSANGGMHVVQADVSGARIFSLRKLFGDNGLSIMGDIRSKSQFKTNKSIALEQIVLEMTIPGEGQPRRWQCPFPTHYFTYLKEDR